MALDQDIALFARVPLFQGMGVDELRLLAFGAQRQRLDAGQLLYRQDDATEGGFVIEHGSLDLIMRQANRDTLLGTFETGSIIGQMGLITPGHRMGTAVAKEQSSVIHVSRTVFLRVLEEYPHHAIELHRRITSNLKETLDGLQDVRRKFAS